MNGSSIRPPASYTPPTFARYIWKPDDPTDRRIRCVCGNMWVPDYRQMRGSGLVKCRREGCGRMVVLVASREIGVMVAEASPADIAYLREQGYDGVEEMLYLQFRPVAAA